MAIGISMPGQWCRSDRGPAGLHQAARQHREGNGVRIVLVEDASRFARNLVVQELGIALLAKRDFWLLTASGDDLTDSDDLGRKMMRGVAGDFMEYEKGRLLAKLRAAGNARRPARGRRPEITC